MRWLAAILLGLLLGTAAAVADVEAGGLGATPSWLVLDMVVNAGFVWAGLAVLGGRLAATPVRASLAGPLALCCAVGGYYTYGLLAGNRTRVGFAGLAGVERSWLLVAVVLGPVLGLVGAATRRPGPLGLLAALVVPAGAVAEMLFVDRLGRLSDDREMTWAQVGIVIVAAVVAMAATIQKLRAAPSRSAPADRNGRDLVS